MTENRSPVDAPDTLEAPGHADYADIRAADAGACGSPDCAWHRCRRVFWGAWWLYSLSHVSTDDARVKGTLITVSSQVPGRLVTVTIEEGQRLKQGEVIAQIQQDDYQAQVVLREAALEAAQSQLANAEADLELARTAGRRAH